MKSFSTGVKSSNAKNAKYLGNDARKVTYLGGLFTTKHIVVL